MKEWLGSAVAGGLWWPRSVPLPDAYVDASYTELVGNEAFSCVNDALIVKKFLPVSFYTSLDSSSLEFPSNGH